MADQSVMTVRLFAAAREAAGAAELTVPLTGTEQPLHEVLANLPDCALSAGDDAAQLRHVCKKSSFLLNGVQARPQQAIVQQGDVLDVLPPFAGG